MKIIYTKTDEAPALATFSFLPIVKAYTSGSGIELELKDISLAARILAVFPDYLSENQRVEDALANLGELAKKPEANIIKLPNISASMPQLKAAINELQEKGYELPDYPEEVNTDLEKEIKARYDKVKGSAVNPVLREGNSDRRAPKAVKNYAKKNPHSMGAWSSDSKTRVACMNKGDFRSNEQSICMPYNSKLKIELVTENGVQLLKSDIEVQKDEICDMTFMSVADLRGFLQDQIDTAKRENILFSLHMKATMMKVSDPIIFGHGVKTYFSRVYDRYSQELEEAGVDVNNGLGDLLAKLKNLPSAVEDLVQECLDSGADIAMVNSDRGITNLHVPSDVIIDASMPAMIRNGGKMWDADGRTRDTLAVIPDSSYAGVYQATIEDCIANGALDPRSMGTVPNVGLMAQKAEEYGSHDKTFEIQTTGTVKVTDDQGKIWAEMKVEAGDIWRMCTVKDPAVQDWVKLAVSRARATGSPTVFWLDKSRAHDAQLMTKVSAYLQQYDTHGLTIEIMNPVDATTYSLERIRRGEDTISVTGNVLRDYLTDLFPILEVGTSAKMLSIVPLMNGGGLFETGAGGSAPKHVQQLLEDNYLRWDSLGEFLALAVSMEHLAENFNNPKAKVLAETLDQATERLLENNKSPQRKLGEIDNRGSHFYLAMYWAQALAAQSNDIQLRERFAGLAAAMEDAKDKVIEELNAVQGQSVDIEGYYWPNEEILAEIMRPSPTFNELLGGLAQAAPRS